MNEETIDSLILDNLKYVSITIRKMNITYNVDECYGAGLIGLIEGCRHYDKSRESCFRTYIITCIRNAICKYMITQNCFKRKSNYNTKSLDESITGDETDFSLHDILDSGIDIEKEYEHKERIKLLHQIIPILNEKDRYIIEHYYGINGCKETTLVEIAKELNISMTRVFYCLNRGYGIIRKIINDKEGLKNE